MNKPNLATTLPVDWDAIFDGTALLGVAPAATKELHLRMLVLEGRNSEASRLRAILDETLAKAKG